MVGSMNEAETLTELRAQTIRDLEACKQLAKGLLNYWKSKYPHSIAFQAAAQRAYDRNIASIDASIQKLEVCL